MKTSVLNGNFYMFGNKGAVWSNEAHIAQSGVFAGGTLCGTPMLSSNWAAIEDVKEIGCPECLAKYKELTSN